MSEPVASHLSEPPSHAAPPRQSLPVQATAALLVGAGASLGAFGAFTPLLGGDYLRGLLVVALLLAGGGLAVSAPFRLRGWPAAVVGSLAAAVLHGVSEAGVITAGSAGVAAAQGMAAGFALGGVLSAAGAFDASGRGILAGVLTVGLLAGTWGYAMPYLAPALGVIFAAAATVWSRPPGRLSLGVAPFAALMLAVLLTGVVVRALGTYPFLGLVLLGPVVAGFAAWWLAVPRLHRAAN